MPDHDTQDVFGKGLSPLWLTLLGPERQKLSAEAALCAEVSHAPQTLWEEGGTQPRTLPQRSREWGHCSPLLEGDLSSG